MAEASAPASVSVPEAVTSPSGPCRPQPSHLPPVSTGRSPLRAAAGLKHWNSARSNVVAPPGGAGPRCGAEARQITGSPWPAARELGDSGTPRDTASAQASPTRHGRLGALDTPELRGALLLGDTRPLQLPSRPGGQDTAGSRSQALGRTDQVWRSGYGDAALNTVRNGDNEQRARPQCTCLSRLPLGSLRAPCRWTRQGPRDAGGVGRPGRLARHMGTTLLGSCRTSRLSPEGRERAASACALDGPAWASGRLFLGCDREREITK